MEAVAVSSQSSPTSTLRCVAPGGTTIATVQVCDSMSLGDLKSQVTGASGIENPFLIAERSGVLHRLTQADDTLVSDLKIGDTIIIHSSKTIVELSSSQYIGDDSIKSAVTTVIPQFEPRPASPPKETVRPASPPKETVRPASPPKEAVRPASPPKEAVVTRPASPPKEVSPPKEIVIDDSEATREFNSLVQKAMPLMEEALKCDENPDIVRGILYICRRQSEDAFIDSMADQLIPDGGLGGMMAVGLLGLANEGSVPATREEVSILFMMLMQKFEGKDRMRIYVDYGPDGGDVTDVLRDWLKLIKAQREHTANVTGEKMKKLPMGWGLPCKSGMRVEKGCATRDCDIIDDHGKVLKENPHETAYVSEDPKDIARAFHLQPDRPHDCDIKFTNRAMARAMGYNFLDDAVKVCNARNFGVLAYLLEGVSSFDDRRYQKIGYKLLNSLCGYNAIHDVKIVTTLFEKGLPIVDPKERYISSDDPFFKMIRSMDHYNLEELLKVVSKGQEIDMYRLKDVQKSLCWSITLRYSDQEYRSDEFNRLLKFWSNIHLEKGARLYDVEESLRKSWSLEICKGVLETAKDRGFKFRSEDCNSEILEIIKDLERSKEAERFDSLMAEVKHFPNYYSGLSSYELRDRAAPLLKKLLEAYTALSETERVEYKGTYESAIRFLDKAVQNGKKGYY